MEKKFDESAVAQLKAEHPGAELILLEAGEHQIVARSPNRAEWKRFRAFHADPAKRPEALETLLFGCLVAPKAAELTALLDRRPGLADVFGSALVQASGFTLEAVEKKL